MEALTQIEYTIAIVTALDFVLQENGIKPGTHQYEVSRDMFAKVMGRTLGEIQLQKITKEVAEAQPLKKI